MSQGSIGPAAAPTAVRSAAYSRSGALMSPPLRERRGSALRLRQLGHALDQLQQRRVAAGVVERDLVGAIAFLDPHAVLDHVGKLRDPDRRQTEERHALNELGQALARLLGKRIGVEFVLSTKPGESSA